MREGDTRPKVMRRWKLALLLVAAGAGAVVSVTAQQRRVTSGTGSTSRAPRHEPPRAHHRHHHARPAPRIDVAARDAGSLDAGVQLALAPDASIDGSSSATITVASPSAPRELPRKPPGGPRRQLCGAFTRPDADGRYVSEDDVLTPLAFVDSSYLLTIVNRSPRFVMDPHDAPTDLIEIDTGLASTPDQCEPPGRQCLRRDAAEHLRLMMNAMGEAGFPAYVHSAFREYGVQCGVFRKWSEGRGQGFCHAVTSSALPGHSQHQLGTAVDLFTREWARSEPVVRPGFGCNPGGVWIAEHSWEFGYVLPYPMPLDSRAPGSTCRFRDPSVDVVDPRTGYRYEPWHIRYIGMEAASRFHQAWLASGPGTGTEITVEQWLRGEAGIDADADLPVCDGCACGLCSTFHAGTVQEATTAAAIRNGRNVPARRVPSGPCGDRALLLDANGEPVVSATPPRIETVQARRESASVHVIATVAIPANTVTQTPVTSRLGVIYTGDPRPDYLHVPTRPGMLPRRYPDLRGAWRLVVSPAGDDAWPWRTALRSAASPNWVNGANLRLPSMQGLITVEVIVPEASPVVRVALMRDGQVDRALVREVSVQ